MAQEASLNWLCEKTEHKSAIIPITVAMYAYSSIHWSKNVSLTENGNQSGFVKKNYHKNPEKFAKKP
jgi:hypothetical protein